jgi:glycerol-3-phosphate cytidylyltransferase
VSGKTIITYGTFDLFHIGHLKLLKSLNNLGDRLIVGISTDEFNEQKGKKTLIPFSQRSEIVESIRYVDKVIPENNWDQKIEDIEAYNVDIFSIGDDWKGKFDFLKLYCDVIYLPRTKNISSTKIKESLKIIPSISKEDLLKAFEIIDQLRIDLE